MSNHITDTQKWLILAVTVSIIGLVYLLSPILIPFILAAFLAYLGDPVVDRLETVKFSRTLAVVFVFSLMLLVGVCFLLFILPLLEEQFRRLVTQIPKFLEWAQIKMLPRLSHYIGLEEEAIQLDEVGQYVIQHWQTLGNFLGKFLLKISASGQLLMLWIGYLLLIPVVTFYLLRDWDILMVKLSTLFPLKYKSKLTKLARDCDAVLAEFLRGQLLVMVAQSVFYSIGLSLVGLEFSILIGVTAGLVSFVPYLGLIVGVGIASIAAFIQFHDFISIGFVLAVFGLGQIFESMVLSPLLIGDRIGLHPVAVIFSVMAGAQLFGFLGMLIALPATAVITVLLRYFLHEHYLNSTLYKN